MSENTFPALESATRKSPNVIGFGIVGALLLMGAFLFYVFFWTGNTPQSSAAADAALKALRKIDGAVTQVGVSFVQYHSLLIEAQAQVNEALRTLPDGELKREMNAAMEAYNDAGQVWNQKINGTLTLWANDEKSRVLMQKYHLQPSPIRFETGVIVGNGIDAEVAQQRIWSEARKHLSRASSLAGQ